MDVMTKLVVGGFWFGRTVIGLATKPYETYRRIEQHGRLMELVPLASLVALYFSLVSVVRIALFRPFLLTREFLLLFGFALLGYGVSVGVLWIISVVLRRVVRLSTLAISWGYTLVPTLAWFFGTSLLYLILPPPRTTSALGITFSVVFLAGSAALLWWKVTLTYLTIRFAMKLDFARICLVYAVLLPILGLYSVSMYRLGIFKVPFL